MSAPEKRTVEANDFMGQAITAGDTIVYPVRRGSKMWMNKLIVQGVQDTPKGKCVSGQNSNGRRINLYNLDNIVIVNPKAAPEGTAEAEPCNCGPGGACSDCHNGGK